MSEVHQPRKKFPRAVLSAMAITVLLFLLVNISFLCVVEADSVRQSPIEDYDYHKLDMAILFFQKLFGVDVARRVMSGVIALSILGNIIVMTFTASRVKQEIAKEGILPWSLFFATGTATPDAWIKEKWRAWRWKHFQQNYGFQIPWQPAPRELMEQTPMAALCLHWFTSIFLVAVTSMLPPTTQYNALIQLYSFVLIVVIGFLVSTGLLYLKLGSPFNKRKIWWEPDFKVWGGPTAALIFSLTTCFLIITAFIQPKNTSLFSSEDSDIKWFIIPTIGISSLLWGVIWWLGLHIVMRHSGKKLKVSRRPYCEKDEEDGEWVLRYEIVDHFWHVDLRDEEHGTKRENGVEEVESQDTELDRL
jgi:amino acid transporter